MFTDQDIFNDIKEIDNFVAQLKEKSNNLEKLSIEAVNAEDKFSRIYSKKLFIAEQNGEKATNLKEKIIGYEDVADARLKWKTAEAVYKAAKLRTENIQSAIDAKRTTLSTKKEIVKIQ